MQKGFATRERAGSATSPSTGPGTAWHRFSTRSLCTADDAKQSTRQQSLQASTRHSSVLAVDQRP